MLLRKTVRQIGHGGLWSRVAQSHRAPGPAQVLSELRPPSLRRTSEKEKEEEVETSDRDTKVLFYMYFAFMMFYLFFTHFFYDEPFV